MAVKIVKAAMIVAVAAMVAGMAYEANTPKGQLVTEVVTVASGETLWTISERYCAKSSSKRDPREFVQGIIEQNYDLLKSRPNAAVIHPGDRLTVTYWRE